MKAVSFLGLIILLSGSVALAQDCEPNDTIPDSLLGVFPMPYDPVESPQGGIKDTACIGFEYNFVFTTVVGDSFTLGQTTLPLDSLWLSTETAVENLPEGLEYACNPPTCVFEKNSKGCVIIYGTPKQGTEGIHKMKLSGKLYADGNAFGLPLSFPDPNIAPGEYTIVVATKNESPCRQLSVRGFVPEIFAVFPNPATNQINITTEEAGNIAMIDALGKVVVKEKILKGENVFEVGEVPSGFYKLVMTSNSHKIAVRKVLIE
ncbi:MAG: T9SS type A sorting domain-containing protein [Bacteroidia bacterium]